MINSLPDLVIALIFSNLTAADRIRKLSLVCKRWKEIVYTCAVWKSVDFNWQRNLTSEILNRFVFAGTREVRLSECCYLRWSDVCIIFKRCKRLDVLELPWLGYRNEAVPLEFSQLNIRYVHYLNLSHCRVSNSLYSQLAFTCPALSVLLLQDSQEISEETYRVSRFKGHKQLKLLNVAHNRAALSVSCIIELLKYSNNRVLLDIRGHHLTEFEFLLIIKEHPDALSRIVDLDDYVDMLY